MTSRSWLKPAWYSPAMLCVSLSVAAHVLVLSGLQSTEHHQAVSSERGHAAKMQVRMVSTTNKARLPEARAPLAQDVSTPTPETVAPIPDAPVIAEIDEASALPADTQPEVQPPQAAMPPAQPYAEYIPRPQLSIAPIPRAPILIAPPDGGKDVARRVIVLSLYIDESGHVRHIEADDEGQPKAYVEAARAAFMAASFSPGQLEGQQVKSRTRVEVVFDNTPLDGAPSSGP